MTDDTPEWPEMAPPEPCCAETAGGPLPPCDCPGGPNDS
jgi:hypothetical protein